MSPPFPASAHIRQHPTWGLGSPTDTTSNSSGQSPPPSSVSPALSPAAFSLWGQGVAFPDLDDFTALLGSANAANAAADPSAAAATLANFPSLTLPLTPTAIGQDSLLMPARKEVTNADLEALFADLYDDGSQAALTTPPLSGGLFSQDFVFADLLAAEAALALPAPASTPQLLDLPTLSLLSPPNSTIDDTLLQQISPISTTTSSSTDPFLQPPILLPKSTVKQSADSSRASHPLSPASTTLDESSGNEQPTAHKAAPGKRRKLTPEEKEQRAKDRAIRNRQAAQDSRDKKRKYMDDLEATNAALQQHNANLAKRLEVTERSNFTLMSRLEDLASQFASISKRFKLTSSTDYDSAGATIAGNGFGSLVPGSGLGNNHTHIITNPTSSTLPTTTYDFSDTLTLGALSSSDPAVVKRKNSRHLSSDDANDNTDPPPSVDIPHGCKQSSAKTTVSETSMPLSKVSSTLSTTPPSPSTESKSTPPTPHSSNANRDRTPLISTISSVSTTTATKSKTSNNHNEKEEEEEPTSDSISPTKAAARPSPTPFPTHTPTQARQPFTSHNKTPTTTPPLTTLLAMHLFNSVAYLITGGSKSRLAFPTKSVDGDVKNVNVDVKFTTLGSGCVKGNEGSHHRGGIRHITTTTPPTAADDPPTPSQNGIVVQHHPQQQQPKWMTSLGLLPALSRLDTTYVAVAPCSRLERWPVMRTVWAPAVSAVSAV